MATMMKLFLTVYLPLLAIGVNGKKRLYSEGEPKLYEMGEPVPLWVNSMTSPSEPYSVDSYRYPFCHPDGGPHQRTESFSQMLAGEKVYSSPYDLVMKRDEFCRTLCISNVGRTEQRGIKPNKLANAIHNDYHHNWIVDGLPEGTILEDDLSVTFRWYQGFPAGFIHKSDGLAYVYNHVNIAIYYKAMKNTDKYEILRFLVEPFSIKHEVEIMHHDDNGRHRNTINGNGDELNIVESVRTCMPGSQNKLQKLHTNYDMVEYYGEHQPASGEVLFTYDVIWIEADNMDWSHRWDIYLTADGLANHQEWIFWRSLSIGVVKLIFLIALLFATVKRILNRQKYQSIATSETVDYSTYGGIPTLHGHIFYPPAMAPAWFTLLCGSGVQLLFATITTLFVFSTVNLNPAHLKATLITVGATTFALGGFLNGLTVAWLSTVFFGERTELDRITLLRPMAFSVILFGLYEIKNFILLIKGVDSAVPFVLLQIYLIGWFGISALLVMLGSALGYSHSLKNVFAPPITPEPVQRQIPEQPWYAQGPYLTVASGFIPFLSSLPTIATLGASLWVGLYDIYYELTFWSVMVILAEIVVISILEMLLQLSKGNHRWWWNTFCFGGSFGIYVFSYSVYCLRHVMGIYVLYMATVFGICTFLVGGSISVIACYAFNAKFFQYLAPINDDGEGDDTGYLMMTTSR